MRRIEDNQLGDTIPAEEVDRFLTVASLYTGVFMCRVETLYEYAEELLGGPVMTHDFGDPAIMDELKQLSRQEFKEHLRQFQGVTDGKNEDREGDTGSG